MSPKKKATPPTATRKSRRAKDSLAPSRTAGAQQLWRALAAYREGDEDHESWPQWETDAVNVIGFAILCLDNGGGTGVTALRSMAEFVVGAKKPGHTFNANIAYLAAWMTNIVAAGESRYLDLQHGRGGWADPLITSLFEGLPDAAKRAAQRQAFRTVAAGEMTVVGALTDLVVAAIQRGVAIGGGATIGRKHTREQVLKIVDNAVRRGPFHTTRGVKRSH